MKKTTVNWRIYKLVQQGTLNRIGRGKFSLGQSKYYKPKVDKKLTSIYRKIKSDFPYLTYCLWSTSIFNEFMLHQPGRFYTLIEVDKDAMENVFYYMKEKNYSVYMEPSKELINLYLIGDKESWVVKSLVSEAPIQEVDKVPTVTIEKALVDIFCDPVIFDAQQGSEMRYIFKEAFEKYSISESKMLRYASRRRKKSELDKYLNEVSKFRQHI